MDSQALKGAIVAKGLTYQNVSDKIGLSLAAFTRKINGSVQFKQDEIKKISALLELKEEQILSIFFKS